MDDIILMSHKNFHHANQQYLFPLSGRKRGRHYQRDTRMNRLLRLKKSPRPSDPSLLVSVILLFLVVCAGTLAYPGFAVGAEDGIHVDQVYLDPADNTVRLYMSGDPLPKAKDIRASFGESSLAPAGKTKRFNPKEGIFYIFLVDMSRPGEMPESAKQNQNSAIEKALTAFVNHSGRNDRIGIIAFGHDSTDSTNIILNETSENKEDINAAIHKLMINDDNRKFAASSANFSAAIRESITLSNQYVENYPKRRVAAILSPNSGFAEEDDAEKTEIREEMQASGLAFYGFGFEYWGDNGNQKPKSKTDLQNFSAFISDIQILGGESASFVDHNTSTNFTKDEEGKNEEEKLETFRSYVNHFSVLTLTPRSDSRSSPTSSPTSLPENTLRIEWGEGKETAEIEIPYPDQGGALNKDEPPSADTAVTTEVVSEEPSDFAFLFGGLNAWQHLPRWLIILSAILIPVIAVLILYLVWCFRDIGTGAAAKNDVPAAPEPLVRAISLIVTDERGETQRMKANISSSLFVGRDPANHLSFPDQEMSQRHFSLILENGDFYIQDLHSANGVYVNGAPVDGRALLRHNDVITAGQRKFVFKCDE
jgi:hypothetical protein